MDTEKLEERINLIYNRLVDETENPETAHNRSKSETLTHLLEVLEFIKGDNDDNPMDSIFWKE
jgi:hypothetical protein